MRTFQGSGRNSSLARALAEFGRIGKTLHLLDLADDELYRRSLLIQVNKGERRHGLARTVFHGRGGELRRGRERLPEDGSPQVRIDEVSAIDECRFAL